MHPYYDSPQRNRQQKDSLDIATMSSAILLTLVGLSLILSACGASSESIAYAACTEQHVIYEDQTLLDALIVPVFLPTGFGDMELQNLCIRYAEALASAQSSVVHRDPELRREIRHKIHYTATAVREHYQYLHLR
jgi:hypothetical protein